MISKPVARKNPVPQREVEIGNRLREFRRSIRLSRVGMAEELGLGLPRLASYEGGRVPLPYHVARLLDRHFSLNYEWLATGKGDLRDSIIVGPDVDSRIPENWAFSKAFDAFLKDALDAEVDKPEPLLKKHLAKIKTANLKFPRCVGADDKSMFKALIARVFGVPLDNLPSHLYWSYYRKLRAAAVEFEKEHVLAKEAPSFSLTDAASSSKTVRVKPQLPSLLERLRKAATEPGKKTELAAFLNPTVPLASVSRWLSGAREPGGEMTLQLLRWVELQERRTK